MLSTQQHLQPGNGSPIIARRQDIVLGCYYITFCFPEEKIPGRRRCCSRRRGRSVAGACGRQGRTHEPILVQFDEGTRIIDGDDKELVSDGVTLVETTPGRCSSTTSCPRACRSTTSRLAKKDLRASSPTATASSVAGHAVLLDRMKALGFKASTLAGLSFGKSDLTIPTTRDEVVAKTQKEVDGIMKQFAAGDHRRRALQQGLDIWTRAATRSISDAGSPHGLLERQRQDRGTDGTRALLREPVFCMVASGLVARSSRSSSWRVCAA
jgi:DNA-directed RNA polymerase subunit beta'